VLAIVWSKAKLGLGMIMRSTVVVPNGWAAEVMRFDAAEQGAHGRRILSIEALAARLAGGFFQPINRIAVLDVLEDVLETHCPAELKTAQDLPGFPRAVASTLSKVWRAGIDLEARRADKPRIAALADLEKAVIAKLPPSMKRPADLASLAIARLKFADRIFGDIDIVGRTQMSAVWRPLVEELSKIVKVRWVAGARSVPDWLPKSIEVVEAASPGVKPVWVSCADGAHEALEAVRWARALIANGAARPHEIAICAAAPQAYDADMAAAFDDSGLSCHWLHGRPVLLTREGQEAAALADILLSGLSLQRFKRLAVLAQGPAFEPLPKDWRSVLPKEAPLLSVDRWKAYLDGITEWPGGANFSAQLLEILELIAKGTAAAEEVGAKLLGGRARSIWERAALEGPAEALLTILPGLAIDDGEEGMASIVWGSAADIASSPRPFVRMIGLASGSWPRSASEDPLLPNRIIPRRELDPLPIADADRADFETILRAASGAIVVSRSRRHSDGRLLGRSPLWAAGKEEIELGRSAVPDAPSSKGDVRAARPRDFGASPLGEAVRDTWRDWHVPDVTKRDGLIRADHPIILASLERTMSASSIRLMLRNPIGWMFKEAMGLSEPDAEDEPFALDARVFGNLVHEVIEEAMHVLGGPSGDEAAVAKACIDASKQVGARMELEAPVPPPRLWRVTLANAAEMAARSLSDAVIGKLPDQKSWAEIKFGYADEEGEADPALPWNPKTSVTIAGVRVRGKIDRVDVSGDGTTARVIDWKTGNKPKTVAQVIDGGKEVQRPIYAAVVRTLMPKATSVEAGLAYIKHAVAWFPVQDSQEALELLEMRLGAMREAIRKGLCLAGPDTGGDYDDYAFALPGDAKQRWIEEKQEKVRAAFGNATQVWEDK